MIEYRDLVDVPLATLSDSFNDAFGDYQLSVAVTESKLEMSFRSGAVDPALSVGAFIDSRLIGFVFNGSRMTGGVLSAYNAATGVVAAHRHQGIATALVERSIAVLTRTDHQRYLLEVLEGNRAAQIVYEHCGFSRTQLLNCYAIPRERLSASTLADKSFVRVDFDERVQRWLAENVSYSPSWQNSNAAIAAIRDESIALAVTLDGDSSALAVLTPSDGSIRQIGWREADGRALERVLVAVAANTALDTIRLSNIPESDERTDAALQRHGFETYVRQWEMVREL